MVKKDLFALRLEELEKDVADGLRNPSDLEVFLMENGEM